MSNVREACEKAREAFLKLVVTGTEVHDGALSALAGAIERAAKHILQANREDLAEAEGAVRRGR